MSAPETIIQKQLEAYNARDVTALVAIYSDDAKLYEYPSKLLASGAEEIRARFAERFKEPLLHAKLLKRIAVGNVVIDEELVTRNFPEGAGTIHLCAIYEIENDRISTARFIFGKKSLGE